MAETLKPPATQRKSRVLAALDNPAFFAPDPSTASPLPPPAFELPVFSQNPLKRRLETPLPDSDYLALLRDALASGKKRKVSDPENIYGEASGSSPLQAAPLAGGFGLRYDQETPIRSIDRGGPAQ
ncbi:hypothetical protein BC628DRAFT_1297430, partial [Trametes gibbosa]